MSDPLFEEFHRRRAQHVPISMIASGSYALVLSMHFHTAIIVQVSEISSLSVEGAIIRPVYQHAAVSQWFSRDPKTPALPLDGDLLKQFVDTFDQAQAAAEAQAHQKPA